MSFDLPPQRKLTLNKMALGVLQPRTGQTIGVRTLVFLYSYLYDPNPLSYPTCPIIAVRAHISPGRKFCDVLLVHENALSCMYLYKTI